MAQDPEYFFLQTKLSGEWNTVKESQSITDMTQNISENLNDLADTKIRIVGAIWNEDKKEWDYDQLFYSESPSEIARLNRTLQVSSSDTGYVEQKTHKQDIKSDANKEQGISQSPVSNYAYLVLIIAGLIGAIGFGIRGGFGIFLTPISTEFGFGREVISLSIALQNLIWGISQPFMGAFADRFGAFKAILVGSLFYCLGMILMSFSTSAGMFHLSLGLLTGIGLAGTATGIIMPAVAKVFPAEKRSWVLGVIGAASSLGSFAILPIGQYFIESIGWSNTSTLIAIVVILMIPLALVFVRGGQDNAALAEAKVPLKDALKAAFQHPGFWFLCSGFFVCGFHVVYIATHLPSYVVDLGFSASTGAWALGIVGLANVVGGYLAGVLGGKYSKKYLLSFLYFGRALVMAGFVLLPPSEVLIFIFAVIMGLFWLSTVPLTTGLVADLYGLQHMSALFGLVFLSHQLGAFLGGWLGGYFYDTTGSYNIVWWISVALGIISAVAHWPIRPIDKSKLALAT